MRIKILTNTTRARLLASSMITGVALAAVSGGQALAQAAPAAQPVQELIVTGSRIPQKNLTSVSPLAVVDSKEIKAQGTVAVESFLQNLPSVIPEFNQGVDNGASGTATVSLRGLGSKRTLVLVDGNRLMPGDPIVPSPDLNNIPAALIDHVEVITGGASAVYGSDAVAGVVNFVMKKNFEGVQFDGQYGFAIHDNGNTADRAVVSAFNAGGAKTPIPLATNKADGFTYTGSVLVGVNAPDGKGNVTAYLGYRNIQPISQDRRDSGACGLSTVSSGSNVYDTHVCQGSSNSAFGKFTLNKVKYADDPGGTNTFVPYKGSYAFNFGPYNYYQQHDDLYTADVFGHYEVEKYFDVYTRFMFADDKQVSQAAPSGLFSNSGAIYQISCNNPLASAQQLALICPDAAGTATLSVPLSIGYRFAGIPRVTDLQHTAYTAAVGFRGDIGQGWHYDVYGQYGKTSFREVFTGDVSIAKINDALNAIPGANGPVCASGNSGCVPLDIFHALAAGFTPAMVNYVSVPALKIGGNTEQIVEGSITGNLGQYGVKSPWASDGVGVAFGGDYRRETLSLNVDNEFASGDLSGSGGVNPPANGSTDVKELYTEARIPIVQDMPYFHLLSLSAGYRFSHYNLSGDTQTYKVSGEWEPITDIRIRGGYNRAVRAPNIVELFNPQVVGNNSINDPCSGATPKATAAQCALTGVTAAEYGNVPECAAAQCSSLTGGNPALKPEEADTYTVGAVLRPRFVPGLSVTIDYFDIKITNPIQQIGAGTIVSQCLNSGVFCNLIHRDQTGATPTGALYGLTTNNGYVIDINQNTGHVTTSGIDFGASYRFHLDGLGPKLGTLDLNFNGTYTQKYETAPFTGSGTYDCAGLYGPVCGEPQSKWKHEMRVTWNTPWNLGVSVNWRYLSGVNLDLNQSNNAFLSIDGSGFVDSIDAHIPAYSYFDLAATYKLKNRYTFRAGVNNVFDRDPPAVDANNLGIAGTTGFGNGNTFPGVYDTVGRAVYIGLTADF